jgi:hypothetical protein
MCSFFEDEFMKLTVYACSCARQLVRMLSAQNTQDSQQHWGFAQIPQLVPSSFMQLLELLG